MADYIPSDAERIADFWVQRNKAAGEARKKVDRNSIPSLDGVFQANDAARAKAQQEAATQEQRPYALQSWKLIPGSEAEKEARRKHVQGE